MSSVSSVVERNYSNRYYLSDGEIVELESKCVKMPFFVYILRTSSNTLYIGQTSDLDKRLSEHRSKSAKSAKYLKYFQSFDLVFTEAYSSRRKAMQREIQLKKWSRKKKEALISGDKILLKKL